MSTDRDGGKHRMKVSKTDTEGYGIQSVGDEQKWGEWKGASETDLQGLATPSVGNVREPLTERPKQQIRIDSGQLSQDNCPMTQYMGM